MISVRVVNGDALHMEGDALITLINSTREWGGYIDRAIKTVDGNHFHNQARTALDNGAKEGEAIYAPGNDHLIQPKAVIFVIDDFRQPLQGLVVSALNCARDNGCNQVIMPALRCGAAIGRFEKTLEETVLAIKTGLDSFATANPDSKMFIWIAVYRDQNLIDTMRRLVA